MITLVCYHCGKPIHLAKPPSSDRRCPNCGRKVHVCDHCQYFDVSGCILEHEACFVVTRGTHCPAFQLCAAASVHALA